MLITRRKPRIWKQNGAGTSSCLVTDRFSSPSFCNDCQGTALGKLGHCVRMLKNLWFWYRGANSLSHRWWYCESWKKKKRKFTSVTWPTAQLMVTGLSGVDGLYATRSAAQVVSKNVSVIVLRHIQVTMAKTAKVQIQKQGHAWTTHNVRKYLKILI